VPSLVALAQAGNEDAFAELYTQHKRRVLSVCLRIVRDYSLAEDLTQEVFLQVHRKIDSFRGDAVFTSWLHRLAVNTVLMHLRKRVLPVVSIDQMVTTGDEMRAERCFGARDLAQAGAIDRLAINHAVARLRPAYRSIFLLHDVQGFDHGEIASMLKCSNGSTKSRLHKARQVLRGALATQPKPNFTASASQVINPPSARTRKQQKPIRAQFDSTLMD
jgi:RNA polymerase sigma-70 factor (ECF subfamily)